MLANAPKATLFAVILVTLLSMATPALCDSPKPIAIAAGDLADALQSISKEMGIELLFDRNQVKGVHTQGVTGTLTSEQAIRKLLEGTNFELSTDESTGAMMIGMQSQAVMSQKTSAVTDRAGMRVSQASGSEQGGGDQSSDKPDEPQNEILEEILVTAQKRIERLQDVPVPVTVISGESLANSNQLRLQDYYSSIPGLSLTPGLQSTQALSIRGLSTGSSFNPTVGVTIDDMPYGASAANGGGNVVPDIDPSELASVEVLRGPQGTLYGASSVGGLLKFVTVDPATDRVSGRVQLGTSDVRNGDELGYNIRGSVNVPLSDSFAVRASAFTRRDPGYIENVVTGEEGINRIDVSGGRLSALWRPSEVFSLKLSALAQRNEGQGASSVSDLPGLGELEQSYIRGSGRFDNRLQAYSATVTAKIGSAELTAISGYNVNKPSDSPDATGSFFGIFPAVLYPGLATGTFVDEQLTFRKFTQEVRLAMPIGEKVDWLVGAFYTREKSRWEQSFEAADHVTGTVAGNLLREVFPTTFREYAGFTNITFHVTDRFDVQAGARQSEIKQTFQDTIGGPLFVFFGAPPVTVGPEFEDDSDAFTYLLTPSYKVSPDIMVYARLASGYRAGGVNPGFGVPPGYDPDKTQNYELGLKGSFLDHVLSVDASVYYIDWKDIQIPQINFVGNAPRAKSQGIELSLELRPSRGLNVSTWVVWNEAELTEDFPADSLSAGHSGDRLPASSRFSGNFSLRKEFPLGTQVTGFAGGTASYVGERKGVFTAALAPRQTLPSYAKFDFIAGATYDTWAVNLFVNNVADKRGVLSGGAGNLLDPTGFYLIPPRTAGVSVVKTF